MKKTTLLLSFLSMVAIAGAQISFSVNYNSSLATGKKMTGVNTGPGSLNGGHISNCLQDIGNEMVRTHDYTGPCDYFNYTNFFQMGSFNYSFQTYNPAHYYWMQSDNKVDSIVLANMQPFFRLGISMQGGMSGPMTPMPKDSDGTNFHTFAGISKRTAMHYNGSWANGYQYNINYWEVWNEPNNNGSWLGTPSEYYLMYKQVVDSMDAYDPGLKVGGPAAATNAFYNGGIHYTLNHDYIMNFMSYCQTNSIPLDFYSFHIYDKKNPYHVRILTDTLEYFLDQYGFTNTELIISEASITTGGYSNTSKGCSYLTSELISLVGSRLSKYFIYRGVDIAPVCDADASGGAVNLTGYAYKFFNEVNDSTPNLLISQGNIFDADNILDSLNNVMILAGKNNTNNVVKILVSHHESSQNTINIALNNLAWLASHQIEMKTEKVIPSGYSEITTTITGGSTMNVNLTSVVDASVYLITLTNLSMASIEEADSEEPQVYPNPAKDVVNIRSGFINSEVTLLDLSGKVILNKENASELDVSNIPSGSYLIRIADTETLKVFTKLLVLE